MNACSGHFVRAGAFALDSCLFSPAWVAAFWLAKKRGGKSHINNDTGQTQTQSLSLNKDY
jgi:hypothetical protein